MSPRTDARAAPDEGPPQDDQMAAKLIASPRSLATVARPVDELATRRELRSWAAAAAWLNQRGYAAAVPGHLADALCRRGLAVWAVSERSAA
jgi:hypothetical protein